MRRNRSILAGAMTLALALSACGGSSDDSESAAPAAATGGSGASGSIEYWLWDSLQLPAYQACADAFAAANPGSTVTVKQYGWDDYWSKINASFTGGTGVPDVFTDHLGKYPEFVGKEQILSLSDALTADKVDTGIYQKGLLDLWTAQDGKIYGLPKDFDTVAIFYNADLATAAGYTADQLQDLEWNPQDGGTYEKFVAHMSIDANGVRGDEAGFDKGNVKTYGMGYGDMTDTSGQTQWSPFTGSIGTWTHTDKNPWGTKYNFDDKQFQDTISWYRSLVEKGYMPPQAKVVGADIANLLGSQTYAAAIDGDWNATNYFKQGNFALAPTPIGPSGKRASMFNGLADSINAGTKNQALSVKWVEFTGSAACQDLVAAKGVVFPAIPEATTKAEAAFKAAGIDVSPFTVHVKDNTTFLYPITDHASDINAVIKPVFQDFMAGNVDVSAFNDANDEINKILEP